MNWADSCPDSERVPNSANYQWHPSPSMELIHVMETDPCSLQVQILLTLKLELLPDDPGSQLFT